MLENPCRTNMLTARSKSHTRLGMHGRSRDAAYWRRRIERDHPEIAERLDAGEIPSVRAAAIEAGLIQAPSGLMHLRRAWRNASPEERAAFMTELTGAGLVRAPPGAGARNDRRAAPDDGSNGGDLFALAPPGDALRPTAELAATSMPAALSLGTVKSAPTRIDSAPLRTVSEGPRRASFVRPPAMAPEAAEPPRVEPPPASARPPHQAALHPSQEIAAASSSAPDLESARRRFGVRRLFGLATADPRPVESTGNGAERAGPANGRVKVGQRYVKVDAGPGAWEVLSIFAGPHDVPHVRIANVEEPDTVRAVSLAVLLDRRRYQLVR